MMMSRVSGFASITTGEDTDRRIRSVVSALLLFGVALAVYWLGLKFGEFITRESAPPCSASRIAVFFVPTSLLQRRRIVLMENRELNSERTATAAPESALAHMSGARATAAFHIPEGVDEMDRARWMMQHHGLDQDQFRRIDSIRSAATGLVLAIMENCPRSPDRSGALRQVREATMTANASIALRGFNFL